MCGVPVIIETPHIREQWRHGWKANYAIDRFVGRFVNAYICVSKANAEYLSKCKGLPANKMNVVYSGIDLRRYRPIDTASSKLRDLVGGEPDDPLFTVIGRLEPQKGHNILLRAMPQVLQRFPRARLVCVGDGSLRDQLESQARELHISDSVRFVGYQSNPAEWYGISAFTVLPSYFEGLPLTCIESLAAGRTMVATAVDGTSEVIQDGKTGLTVSPGDPASLAEAICRLLADRDLCSRLAIAGRELVLSRFGAERFVDETQRLYLRAWEASCRRVTHPASFASAG